MKKQTFPSEKIDFSFFWYASSKVYVPALIPPWGFIWAESWFFYIFRPNKTPWKNKSCRSVAVLTGPSRSVSVLAGRCMCRPMPLPTGRHQQNLCHGKTARNALPSRQQIKVGNFWAYRPNLLKDSSETKTHRSKVTSFLERSSLQFLIQFFGC